MTTTRLLTMTVLAAMAALAAAGCSRLDGIDPGDGGLAGDAGLVSGLACKADLECGAGRYCSGGGVCAIDCITSKDCVYQLSDPAQPNNMECSACGRCIPEGSKDAKCVLVSDIPCERDAECVDAFGENYVCSAKKSCVRTCLQDKHCREVGRGWYCGDDKLCYRKCMRDLDCILHGWHMVCDLPPGTDGEANAYRDDPIVSECVPREGGVDWGANIDPSKPTYQWRGVWGMMLNTAVRTTGLPLVNQQDTVSNQYLLVKVAQDGNGIVFNLKWCTLDLKNFKEDDTPFQDLAWIVTPDLYADHIFIQKLHGYNTPALEAGAAFVTDRLLEVRGARLANPETDQLPNYNHLEGQWDQDNDGNPGMTNLMTGVLSAEIYNAQRWTAILNVNVVGDNHMQGLVEHSSQQNMLGASKKEYVYDTVSLKHPQADRSFFKALRMADTASCNDVIAERKTKGSWLEFDVTRELGHYDPNAKP